MKFQKSDSEILYQRFKNVLLKFGKDKDYISFVMRDKPNHVAHHACGSTMGLKSSDYGVVAVNPVEHLEQHDNRDWLFARLPEVVENLCRYIEHQKSEIERLKK